MRLSALILGLSLLLPTAALAQGHGKRGKSAHATHERSRAKEKKPGVAGALSDGERAAPAATPQPTSAPAPRGPQRIDFDDRVIEGQTNKSGAVYLYDRKDLQVDSMVKQPNTFRSEIAKGLFQ